jgi:hypothetical protein
VLIHNGCPFSSRHWGQESQKRQRPHTFLVRVGPGLAGRALGGACVPRQDETGQCNTKMNCINNSTLAVTFLTAGESALLSSSSMYFPCSSLSKTLVSRKDILDHETVTLDSASYTTDVLEAPATGAKTAATHRARPSRIRPRRACKRPRRLLCPETRRNRSMKYRFSCICVTVATLTNLKSATKPSASSKISPSN